VTTTVGVLNDSRRRSFRFNIDKKQICQDIRRRGSLPCHFDDGVIGRRCHGQSRLTPMLKMNLYTPSGLALRHQEQLAES